MSTPTHRDLLNYSPRITRTKVIINLITHTMRFVTAVFPILLNLAAATFHFSCVCNSITPGTDWVYNWELTKRTTTAVPDE
ncbi:hypothetical protein E4U52_007950 [Claviceps spartinae]|nr:hypothetical protein E4U52_007950 [Claviceps spartinae]